MGRDLDGIEGGRIHGALIKKRFWKFRDRVKIDINIVINYTEQTMRKTKEIKSSFRMRVFGLVF